MFLRSGEPFNYNTNEASDASGLKCEDVSLAKQSFAEECDINTIVRRFGLTGELPSNVRVPVHGDFRNLPDFHGAMRMIREAQEGFARLPANVRARFHNDAGELIDFLSDVGNRDEAVKLGLVVAQPAAPAAETAVAAPASAVVKS
ncbi:MAG: internal scaffolding protein [Microviridae sp.]|nr:MAG: internal scaffolding protein [Microviridae sp.]